MTTPDTRDRSDGHVLATWCGELSQNKIAAHHRERLAVVYVRQSTPRQVLEHRESTALQYQLQQRAVQLGWQSERVLVVDDDLGQSGASAVHRVGFQRLLAEIGLNHVGLVLGIEMSRLARSCKDWYHLIELCAVFRSLLADEDGVYDPTNYNDRLLLGLKGTMSEAELHILRGRMEQGRRNKAARGELFSTMPIGYVQTETGEVLLDPDEQAQAVVRLVFAKFEQIGTCRGTLRYLLQQDIRLPYRPHHGPQRGELEWRRASLSTVHFMLKHPQYAGAYAHGRHQTDPRRKRPGHPSSGRVTKEQADWHVLLWDWLPAYIGREQYERNQKRLRQNASTFEALGAPRQGRTLLSGLIRCARCRRRMYVAYGDKPHVPRYMCSYDHLLLLQESRPSLASRVVDALVERQVLQALSPAGIELSLAAEQALTEERRRLRQQHAQQLQRAEYQAELGRRQYDAVDPENRLVAAEVERRWNQRLVELQQARETLTRFEHEQPLPLTAEEVAQLHSLSGDVHALWETPSTTVQQRQEVIRQLIESVVIDMPARTERIELVIRWVGGFESRHEVIRPVGRYEQLQDVRQLRTRLQELRQSGCTSTQIAQQLNAEGFRTPRKTAPFNRALVDNLLARWKLVRSRGSSSPPSLVENEWELEVLATELQIPDKSLRFWCRKGWVHARRISHGGRIWIIWADGEERQRLRDLRAAKRVAGNRYPAALKTPKKRPRVPADSVTTDNQGEQCV